MKLKLQGFESTLMALCSPFPMLDEWPWPKTRDEWKAWYDLAVLNRVETQIYQSCLQKKVQIPEPYLSLLKNRSDEITKQNQLRRLEAKKLFSALEKNNIEFLVLKGNAIAQEIYQNLDYKQMNDFDLLFHKKDLDQLLQIYQDLDYLSAAALEEDFRKQEKYSHHWPPFFSRNLHLFIGTHWNVVSPLSSVKISEEFLWQGAESFVYGDRQLKRLSPQNFFFHFCVHLSPFKLGLKELSDIYNFFISIEPHFSVEEFVQVVKKTQSVDPVYRTVKILESLFTSGRLSQLCFMLEPLASDKIRKQVQFRTTPALKTLYLRTSHISKIEKNFGLFSLTESPLEKAHFLGKMWKTYLWPSREESFRLCHQIPNKNPLQRVWVSFLSVVRITQALMQDLGPGIFIFVTLRHHVELTKAVLRKIMGRPCPGLEEKVKRLGLNLADLKALSQLE